MATTSGGLDVAVPGVNEAGRPVPGESGGQLFRDYPPFARGDDGHTQICEWATRVETSLSFLANSIDIANQSARSDIQNASNLAESTLNMIVADAQKEFLFHRDAIGKAYLEHQNLVQDTRNVVDKLVTDAKASFDEVVANDGILRNQLGEQFAMLDSKFNVLAQEMQKTQASLTTLSQEKGPGVQGSSSSASPTPSPQVDTRGPDLFWHC